MQQYSTRLKNTMALHPRHWQPSAPEAAPSSYSYPYSLDLMEISNDSQSMQTHTINSGSSFQNTLLEIEHTFFKTFPAAAHAVQNNQHWGPAIAQECDDRNILPFSQSSGMDADMNAFHSLSSRPAAFASTPTVRNHVSSDILMGDDTHPGPSFADMASRQVPFAPVVGLQGPYSPTSGSMASPSFSPSYSIQASLASASFTSTAMTGSFSDACPLQSTFRSPQTRYTPPYVAPANPENNDDRVAPIASLNRSPHCTLHAAPPVQTASSLLCQYPIQAVPRATSVPRVLSPRPLPTGYRPAVAHTNTTNHLNPYHSPDPSASPPSITLYPVPQAPLDHSIPPWPLEEISPEPVPHRHSTRDASSSRSASRRKRVKDNDKKPPLACLFCRGRKIACGPPAADGDGKTCNQCHRRSLKCDYPAESRRGMRKDKSLQNFKNGGAKVIMKPRKR